MLDPFPIPQIPAQSRAVQPWAERLGFTTLPLHIHEIVLITFFYEFTNSVISPALSSRFFPVKYGTLSRSKKINWNVHVVSLLQSTLINVLALWIMFSDEERSSMDRQERVYGYTGAAGMIQALATGYFVWDLYVTAPNVNIFGPGALAHAISALTVYSFGFRPFVNFYSCTFILWELSTPFLNIHWFFDKLGMTGSFAQLVNGIILIATFFFCRLIYGTSQSFAVFRDLWGVLRQDLSYIPSLHGSAVEAGFPARYDSTMQFVTESSKVPIWLAVLYLSANATLTFLNFYWFFKMIEALRKRFDSKEEKPAQAQGIQESGDKGFTTGLAKPEGQPRLRAVLDGEGDSDVPPPVI